MLHTNFIANIVSYLWGIFSVFLFIPLFIGFLGVEAYGLVGFYATLSGFLALADIGFTASLKREMACLSVKTHPSVDMKNILRTYERAYGFISFSLALLIFFLAPLIATNWLSSSIFHANEMTTIIRIMGISIALQLPSGLYIGGLMGLQRQVWANSLNIGNGLFRSVGAVIILWLFSPTILAFILWQLISNVFYLFSTRFSLWKAIPHDQNKIEPKFKWKIIRSNWRFTASMAGISVIGVALSQSDKLIVSKILPLEMLSYYTLAGAVASIPITLANAMATAVFPRFTELVTLHDTNGLKMLYRRICEIIGIIIVPAGLTLAFFSGNFIYAWTGSTLIAEQAGLTTTILILGQLIQSITVIPYNFAVANANTKYSLYIGAFSFILITPLLIYLTSNFNIVGTAISWLVLNTFALPFNLYYLHRTTWSNQMWRSCLRGVAFPFLYTLPCILIGGMLLPEASSKVVILGQLALVWFVSFVTSTFAFPSIRSVIIQKVLSFFILLRAR